MSQQNNSSKLNMELKKEIKKNIIFLLIISLIFYIDRATKNLVVKFLLERNSSYYVNDYLNLDLVWNSGIGFGLLSFDSSIFYHTVTAIISIVIFVLIYLFYKSKTYEKIFYSSIIGGAIGNIYDRLIYFSVPDFVDLHFANFHWFTFNVADIFISVGVIGLILNELLKKKDKDNV